MKHNEGYFTNGKKQSIYYQYWLPKSDPNALMLIIHGLNEHSGRYKGFAEYYVQQGFGVFSMDLVGHGKSAGYQSYIDDFMMYLDDFFIYLDMMAKWLPKKQLFLIGHSMGGLIGALLLVEDQTYFSGAVLSASVVQVPEDISPLIINIGKLLSAILPKIGLLKLDLPGLCRNPDVVQAYIDDPLVNSGKFSARISSEMNKAINVVAETGTQITLPVLILHGGDDRIVSPSDSRYLYQLVSSEDKQLIIYDSFYHEIYNDPGHEQVYSDVLSWLNSHIT